MLFFISYFIFTDHATSSTLQITGINSTELSLDSSTISLDATAIIITNTIISQDKSFSFNPFTSSSSLAQTDSLDFTTSYSANQYSSSIEDIKSLQSDSTSEIIQTSSFGSLTDAYSSPPSMWYSGDVTQTYSSPLINTFAETVITSNLKAESSLYNLNFSFTSLSDDMLSKSQSLLYDSLLPSTMLSVENTPSFIPITSIVETNGLSSTIFLSILSVSSTTSKSLSEVFTSNPLQPSDSLSQLITKSSNFETQYTENIGSTPNSSNIAEDSGSLLIQASSHNSVTLTNISTFDILNAGSFISHSSLLPTTNLRISSLTTYVVESLSSFVSDLHINSSKYQSIDSFSYVSSLSTDSISNSPLATIYVNSKNSLETDLSHTPSNSGLFSLTSQTTTSDVISSTLFQTVEDLSASSASPVISEGISQSITYEYFTQSSQYATPIYSRYSSSEWELSNSIDSTAEYIESSVSLQTIVVNSGNETHGLTSRNLQEHMTESLLPVIDSSIFSTTEASGYLSGSSSVRMGDNILHSPSSAFSTFYLLPNGSDSRNLNSTEYFQIHFSDVYSSVFSSRNEATVENSVSNSNTTLTVLSTVYSNSILSSNDVTLSVTVGESGIQSELLNSFQNSLHQESVNTLQLENVSESSQLYLEKTLSVNNFLTDSFGSVSSGDTRQLSTSQLTEKTQMTRDFSFQTGSNEQMYSLPFTLISIDESQLSMTDYLTPSFEANLMSTAVASQSVYETEFSSISIVLSINSQINSQLVSSDYLSNKFSTVINTAPWNSDGNQQLYTSSEFLSETKIIDSFSDFATLHSENSLNNLKSTEFSNSFQLRNEDFASNTSPSVLEILPTITTTQLPQETEHFTGKFLFNKILFSYTQNLFTDLLYLQNLFINLIIN